MSLSLPIVVILLLLLVMSSIRVLKEYERGVMFTLGRFTGVKGPGVRLVLPVIQQMKKVELHHRAECAEAGRDFQGQRFSESQRGALFSNSRSGKGHFAGD
jgi:regulator of protease activity HflC (stomatin/prohibitin superfamily)